MSRHCLPLALLLLAGCGTAAAPNASATANVGQTQGATEAALAAITDRCGLPRTALKLESGLLVLNPPTDAGQAKFDCLLREISANRLTANLQMGFVGNEYQGRDNAQAR